MPSAQILPEAVSYPSRFRMRNIPATAGAKHIRRQKSFFLIFFSSFTYFFAYLICRILQKKSREDSAHVSNIKCFFITFCFANRIQKICLYLDVCIYTIHFISIFQRFLLYLAYIQQIFSVSESFSDAHHEIAAGR